DEGLERRASVLRMVTVLFQPIVLSAAHSRELGCDFARELHRLERADERVTPAVVAREGLKNSNSHRQITASERRNPKSAARAQPGSCAADASTSRSRDQVSRRSRAESNAKLS